MSTQEIADGVAALLKEQKFEEAGQTYWADDVVSIEAMGPPGVPLEMHGKEAVAGKGRWFMENHEIHANSVGGPYVNGDQFALRLTADVTFKLDGKQHHLDEIALYTVKDGKIVEERFLMASMV